MSVLLNGIQWETYEKLVCDLESQNGPRLAYDHGTLEIMSPLPFHENRKDALTLLINVVAEEQGLNIQTFGSATFRRASLQRGVEPDSCVYIHSPDRFPGNLREVDSDNLPVPDIVIEVDQTSPSLDKLPIYAALGVPEIWRDNGQQVTIFQRTGEGYEVADVSNIFANITAERISYFLDLSLVVLRLDWLRQLRTWARGEEQSTDE